MKELILIKIMYYAAKISLYLETKKINFLNLQQKIKKNSVSNTDNAVNLTESVVKETFECASANNFSTTDKILLFSVISITAIGAVYILYCWYTDSQLAGDASTTNVCSQPTINSNPINQGFYPADSRNEGFSDAMFEVIPKEVKILTELESVKYKKLFEDMLELQYIHRLGFDTVPKQILGVGDDNFRMWMFFRRVVSKTCEVEDVSRLLNQETMFEKIGEVFKIFFF